MQEGSSASSFSPQPATTSAAAQSSALIRPSLTAPLGMPVSIQTPGGPHLAGPPRHRLHRHTSPTGGRHIPIAAVCICKPAPIVGLGDPAAKLSK